MSRAAEAASNGPRETILVVEDDRALREGLTMNFRLRGYRVLEARDGREGMTAAFEEKPDLIILDLMLPGLTGFDILGELREREVDVPVLILSAFRLGADDYVTKPFQLPELVARVEGMLRKARRAHAVPETISFGNVAIDVGARSVSVGGSEVGLLAKEFDLLCLLARNPGKTFSREAILERIWGYGFEGTSRTVDNYVMSLRHKLEEHPSRPRHIRTVRQVGYRLDP